MTLSETYKDMKTLADGLWEHNEIIKGLLEVVGELEEQVKVLDERVKELEGPHGKS